MIRLAVESGTKAIAATPHANSAFPYDPEATRALLAQLAGACDCPVSLHQGCELQLLAGNIRRALARPTDYTINGRSYLLVEFSDFTIPPAIDEIFSEMGGAGIRPLIAHPERNRLLVDGRDRLRKWVSDGVALQLTADSVLGRYGKRAEAAALEWIADGLASVLASDGHDLQQRPPSLAPAFDFIAREFGGARAEQLFRTAPAAILAGEPVASPPPAPRRRWFFL